MLFLVPFSPTEPTSTSILTMRCSVYTVTTWDTQIKAYSEGFAPSSLRRIWSFEEGPRRAPAAKGLRRLCSFFTPKDLVLRRRASLKEIFDVEDLLWRRAPLEKRLAEAMLSQKAPLAIETSKALFKEDLKQKSFFGEYCEQKKV